MTKYSNAYTEVSVILDSLVQEDFDKIPPEVIDAIYENRNLEYNYEINDDIGLKDQQMLPETKAILFNLFRDYLSTPEQKEKIIKMQNEERQKTELKKQKMYSLDVFNNQNKKDAIKQEVQEKKLELIDYKESFLAKVWKKLKSIFCKKIKKNI